MVILPVKRLKFAVVFQILSLEIAPYIYFVNNFAVFNRCTRNKEDVLKWCYFFIQNLLPLSQNRQPGAHMFCQNIKTPNWLNR